MDEGVSLQKLLYSITMSKVSAVMEPSLLWRKLRTSKGASSLRGIMQQIVASVATLHFKGITHRDVKPSNILLNTEEEARILMADFSSAVSEESLSEGLYGVLGPLVAEETLQYAPPEVLLSMSSQYEREIPYNMKCPTSYDSWSVGVVFLEMILGTSDVFTVDQRTAALIAHRMKGSGADSQETSDAMLLAAFADYCIYRRTDNSGVHARSRERKDGEKDDAGDGGDRGDGGADEDDEDVEGYQERQELVVETDTQDQVHEIDGVQRDSEDSSPLTRDLIGRGDSRQGEGGRDRQGEGGRDRQGGGGRDRQGEGGRDRQGEGGRVDSRQGAVVALEYLAHQRKKDNRRDRKTSTATATTGTSTTRTSTRGTRTGTRTDTWYHHLQPMAKQPLCGLEDLRQAILRRDPLGTGLNDRWGLDLLSRLLKWEPSERILMADGKIRDTKYYLCR